jgi:hypothetical protein
MTNELVAPRVGRLVFGREGAALGAPIHQPAAEPFKADLQCGTRLRLSHVATWEGVRTGVWCQYTCQVQLAPCEAVYVTAFRMSLQLHPSQIR